MNYVSELERLKRRVEIRDEIIKDFKAIERKETNRLHKIIDELKDTIEELKAEIAEKDAQIKKLQDSSLNFLIETAEMRSTIEQQRDKLYRIQQTLGDVHINQLNEIIKILHEGESDEYRRV